MSPEINQAATASSVKQSDFAGSDQTKRHHSYSQYFWIFQWYKFALSLCWEYAGQVPWDPIILLWDLPSSRLGW